MELTGALLKAPQSTVPHTLPEGGTRLDKLSSCPEPKLPRALSHAYYNCLSKNCQYHVEACLKFSSDTE